MKCHQTRMLAVYIDAGGALLGILASSAGIYLALRYGYPLKTLLAESAREALVIHGGPHPVNAEGSRERSGTPSTVTQ